MADMAWLINVARGAIVDEAALFDVLTNNGIAGAALDVFSAFFRAGAALSLAVIVPALFLPGRPSRA